MNIRIGNGYDLHQLVPERKLILGGVEIPHNLGLLGHSDADVLTHAIMDALLGALGMGDIGHYFPPNDPQWKGANSLVLMKQIAAIIQSQCWKIGNIDSTVVAERPKLKPYLKPMRTAIAQTLNIEIDQISIKATTNEQVDAVGREEAICAYAVALLVKD